MTRKIPLLPRQLAQAITLASGFGVVWFVLMNLVGEEFVHALLGPEPVWPMREAIVVRADGTPLVRNSVRGNSTMTIRDLDGRDVTELQDLELLQPLWLPVERPATSDVGSILEFSSPSGWEHRLGLFVDDQYPSMNWFFVHNGQQEGAGYFVAFDQTTRQKVGVIGQSGFHTNSSPPDDPFPVRYEAMRRSPTWSTGGRQIVRGKVQNSAPLITLFTSRFVYVPSEHCLVLVDLGTRSVRNVFEADEPVESLAILNASSDEQSGATTRGKLLVRTRGKVFTLSQYYQVLRAFTIPNEVDRQHGACWYESPDGRAIAEFYRPWVVSDDSIIAPKSLYRIGADGAVKDRTDLLLSSGMLEWHKQHVATLFRWALPVPALLPVVEPFMIMFIDQEPSYESAVRSMLRNSWPSLVGTVVVAALFAVAAWRRASAFRLSNTERLVWAGFVLAFGLFGYVGFLLHRQWTLRQQCPRCRSLVPWDRGDCAGCGKPFPAAASEGIEVFC